MEPIGGVCVCIYIYLEKERDLFQGIDSCNCGGWQVWNLQKRPAVWELWQESMLSSWVQKQSGGRIPSFLRRSQSFLLRPLTDWMKPTPITDSNLLLLKVYLFNHILKRFPRWLNGKNSPTMQETWAPSLSSQGPLEKDVATHSSILA